MKTRRLAAIHPPSPVAFTFAVCATEDKTADIKRLRLVSKGDRNRRIGEFLKELDFTEARNTGYPVILGATKTNGSPKPILETNTHRDYFTFILPIHEMFLKSDAETVRELNVTDPAEGVNEGVKILLAAIRKNPGKRTNELALLIGKSAQTVERYVKYNKGNIERREESELVSRQFENRLFDRDTLIIAHYDINFLFIVSLYARANASAKLAWKEKMRRRFRKDIQEMLQKKFKFYAMTPNADVDAERYIKDNFRLLLGKVFAPYSDSHEESTYYSLALIDPGAMPTKTAADVKRRDAVVEENDAVIECLQDAFLIKDCPLGKDPSKVVEGGAASEGACRRWELAHAALS